MIRMKNEGVRATDVHYLMHDGVRLQRASENIAAVLRLEDDDLARHAALPQAIWRNFPDSIQHPATSEYAFEIDLETEQKLFVRQQRLGDRFLLSLEDRTEASMREMIFEQTTAIMAQGLLVHDRTYVIAANARLAELLDVPEEMLVPGRPWVDFVNVGMERGDYGAAAEGYCDRLLAQLDRGGPASWERCVNGRTISLEGRYADGIGVVTYTDITAMRERQKELEEAEARARYNAERDDLTGLTNRRAFDGLLKSLVEDHNSDLDRSGTVGIVLVGLDHFKAVNDSRGHDVGDTVLQRVSARLSGIVEDGDVLSRIGGDEFAIAIVRPDGEAIHAFAQKAQRAVCDPVFLDDLKLRTGASVGVAQADEGDTDTALKSAADLALHKAKKVGRGRVVSFTSELATEARDRSDMETDLEAAICGRQLEMHYQVQHDLRNNEPVGYEALMRWRCPKRGLVSPAHFIPLAEETGLIVKMGRWALLQSVCDIASLDNHTRISVNVSPIQFTSSDVVADVKAALDASGISPWRLEVEVTEALLLHDVKAALDVMKALSEVGVTTSLDDFGTGFSSLSYLTTFPFKKLKIDRSFVMNMIEDQRSSALVNSILTLARSLEMKVTAEGVETEAQLLALTKSRCDEAQGYLLGRPMPFETISSSRTMAMAG